MFDKLRKHKYYAYLNTAIVEILLQGAEELLILGISREISSEIDKSLFGHLVISELGMSASNFLSYFF